MTRGFSRRVGRLQVQACSGSLDEVRGVSSSDHIFSSRVGAKFFRPYALFPLPNFAEDEIWAT